MDFNLSHAMAVLLLALMATGAGEYTREMLRKPYVIGRWMYSNGVRVPYCQRINHEGYLAHTQLDLERSCQRFCRGAVQLLARRSHLPRRVRLLPHPQRLSPAPELLDGRDRTNIRQLHRMLHDYKPDSPYRRFMPPMVGTKQDIDDLTNYLNAQVNPPAPGTEAGADRAKVAFQPQSCNRKARFARAFPVSLVCTRYYVTITALSHFPNS